MGAEAKLIQASGLETYTDPSAAAAYSPGEVVPAEFGGLGVIADTKAVALGDPVAIHIAGEFEVAKTVGETFAAAAAAYWNDTTNAATATASGNTYIGHVTIAAVSADTTLRIQLNHATSP